MDPTQCSLPLRGCTPARAVVKLRQHIQLNPTGGSLAETLGELLQLRWTLALAVVDPDESLPAGCKARWLAILERLDHMISAGNESPSTAAIAALCTDMECPVLRDARPRPSRAFQNELIARNS